MKQSQAMSLVEAVTNVVVGYGIAVAAQFAVFPLFGLSATLAENMLMGGVFTILSMARSFALRRVFEAVHVRKGQRDSAARARAAEDVLPDGA